MKEGEKIIYSFYVMEMASFAEYFVLQMGALLRNKHNIVPLTNKRLMINQMDAMGKMTGVGVDIEKDMIDEINMKRGFLKTTVKFTISGHPLIFKPNNICIGMPYHKDSLIEMAKTFK